MINNPSSDKAPEKGKKPEQDPLPVVEAQVVPDASVPKNIKKVN